MLQKDVTRRSGWWWVSTNCGK